MAHSIPFPITCVFEFICFLVSVLSLRERNKKDWIRYFPLYLFFVFAFDLYGYIESKFIHAQNNYWLYNCFKLIDGWFCFLILYKISATYYTKKIVYILEMTLGASVFIYEAITIGFSQYFRLTDLTNNVCVIFSSLMYYYYLLKDDEMIKLSVSTPFWIVAGFFFFSFGSITTSLFFKYLADINKQLGIPVRYIIFIAINLILYSCWSYAFICRYKQRT